MKLTQAKERTLMSILARATRKGDLNTVKEATKRLLEGGSQYLKNQYESIESIEDNAIRISKENILKLENKLRKEEHELEQRTKEIEYKKSKEYGMHKAQDTLAKGELRMCNCCNVAMKPNLFGINRATRDGLNNTCKKCKNANELARGNKKLIDPKKQKENNQRARKNLERKYKEFLNKTEGFLIDMGYEKALGVKTKNLYVNKNADFKKITAKNSKHNWMVKDLNPCLSYHGYYEVGNVPVHRIMAYTFLKHTRKGHEVVVDHINNNKLDNSITNLQLLTNSENLMKGKVQTGGNNKFEKYIKHIDY